MATQTRSFLAYESVGVVFEYDYDDVTNYVVAFRCINNSSPPQDAWGEVTVDDSSPRNRDRKYARVFGEGTTELTVPTNQANRVELVVGPKGNLVGCYLTLIWPYP
jgi:hypothetical protein